jgi:hypothetical protein
MATIAMDDIFYTGPGVDNVPRDDVVRVRVDPSVRRINNGAFVFCKKLTEWSCVKASCK